MSITGHAGQGPVRVGIAINDTSAGLLLANGIMLALLARERTGEGQWVHTSLLEAQIFMLDFQASRYSMKGEVAEAGGQFPPDLARHRHVPDRRRLHQHRRLGRQSVEEFCEVAGDKDLRRTIPISRRCRCAPKTAPALNAHLNDIVRQKPSAYWVERSNKAGVPCGPINTIDQVFADPQVQHLGIADAGRATRKLGAAEGRRPADPHERLPAAGEAASPTPDAGEHTEEILKGLGYTGAQIAELREKKVV